MLLIRRPRQADPALSSGCVATIGVFDGVHLGHQRIFARVIAAARQQGIMAVAFTFEPTPQELIRPGSPPARLTRWREKYQAMRRTGMDCMFCPPFDRAMAGLDPQAFIDELLVARLRVRHLVVGDDFRFARGRAGTFGDLEAAGRHRGFGVEQVASVMVAGERVSSTAIRAALAAGELDRAATLLGRPYTMAGRVVGGRRLGRTLGFPTANVALGRRLSPLAGIFAVRVAGLGATALPGVASIGTRPTVAEGEPLLEVHLFDFDADIYGRLIEVEFVARLRDECRFSDLDALRRQMEKDAAAARDLLARTTTKCNQGKDR